MNQTEINLRLSALTLMCAIVNENKERIKPAMERLMKDVEASQEAEKKESKETKL